MNYEPKVSVIVPTYNVREYLEECLESILKQTIYEMEIICIDDGSTDGSSEILDTYSLKDSRIKVYHRENGGYGKAMNIGLSIATGKYVAIVEPDDYIEKNMFEDLYKIAEKEELDWIKSNFKRFYGSPSERSYEEVPLTNDVKYYEKVINPSEKPSILKLTMNIWTGLYNRKFLVNNNIAFNETPGASFQDNGFWIQTLVLANRVYFKNSYYYMNRRDNPNSSVKNTEKAMCVIEEFRFIDKFLAEKEVYREKFIHYYVLVKLIGYIGIFNRSSRKQQFMFINEASIELKKHMDSGEINPDLFGPIRWKALNDIISDPVQYFINHNSKNSESSKNDTRKILDDIQEKLVIIQNKYANRKDDFEYEKILCDNIKISVIIPVHNMEQFISECLKSVLSQSLKEIEVICINDGSTDNTYDVIMSYMQLDFRIRLINQIAQGAGAARNAAIEIARGEYIAFMDADDWYPDCGVLEKLYNKAVENNANICGGSMCAYKNGILQESPDYYTFLSEGYINYSDYQEIYGYTRYIFKRSLILENNIRFPEYIRFQDPVFFAQIMNASGRFYAMCDATYSYRKGHKKVKWSEKQCVDLLDGIKDLLELSKSNGYQKMYDSLINKLLEEYIEFYGEYVCRHSIAVSRKFIEIIQLLDVKKNEQLLGALFDYMARKYVIPFRKYKEKYQLLENRNEEYKIKKRASEKQLDSYEKQLDSYEKQLESYEKQIAELNYSLHQTRISFTYRIGRIITFIPRSIRKMMGWKPI